MEIAILNYHRVGGSGIVAYEIGKAMSDRGHMVHFMGLEPPFRLKDNFSETMQFHRVELQDYPVFNYPPYTLALASQLADLISHQGIEVVHSHYALPHAVAAILAREITGREVRCITTLHGTDITVVGAHPTMKNITRFAIEHSDAVTTVSNSLKQQTADTFKINVDRIHTIYNFINPRFFNPELKRTVSMNMNPEGKFIAMHMSNLRSVKSPLDVIRIFHGLTTRSETPMELWIVGEGPLRSEMCQLAGDLGIDRQVRFLGIRNIVGPIVANADLFLMPSSEESFGLSALEAMACGVPVLAANAGGLPEVVVPGKTGELFDKGNVEHAIELGLPIVNDPALRETMGKAGAAYAVEQFEMDRIISQYEALYRGDSPA